jgi:BASS family bile acid:Na+ symporter
MFLVDTLTKVLFFIFVVGSMLGIGLKITKDDLLAVVRDRSWLARVLVANFVLIPALGILVAKTLAAKPENELALILLACAPGGLGAIQFLTKTREEMTLAYAGGTAFLLTFLSVFISPLLAALALPEGLVLTVPYVGVIAVLSIVMLVPLALGMLVHQMAGAVGRKLAGPVALAATAAFVAGTIKTLALTKQAKSAVGTKVLIGIVLFIFVSMLIGWVFGGPKKGTRSVLATASSMRNAALCLAIAVRSFPDIAVVTPLVAFMAIMVPLNMLFMVIFKAVGKIQRH